MYLERYVPILWEYFKVCTKTVKTFLTRNLTEFEEIDCMELVHVFIQKTKIVLFLHFIFLKIKSNLNKPRLFCLFLTKTPRITKFKKLQTFQLEVLLNAYPRISTTIFLPHLDIEIFWGFPLSYVVSWRGF